jgi:hypothetical protein
VQQIYFVDDIEYYSVKYPKSLFGEFSFPVNKNTCELYIDKNNISSISNIINSNISYSGAEIRYWFFIKNIDLSSNAYNGFWSFIDPDSKSLISDDKFYFLKAIYKDGKYIKCRISLDREKEEKLKKKRK